MGDTGEGCWAGGECEINGATVNGRGANWAVEVGGDERVEKGN